MRSVPLPIVLPLLLASAAAQDDPLRLGGDDAYLRAYPFVQVDALIEQDTPDGFPAQETDVNVARLYVEGGRGDLSALFAYEFAGEFIKYAFASYAFTDALSVTVGQQDEPFSLTDLPGGKATTFADGAETAALIPGDNLGVRVSYDGGTYALSGGVYGGDFLSGIDEEGVAFSGRATWNPLGRPEGRDLLVHLGGAVSFRGGTDLNAGFAQGVGAGILPRSIVSVGDFEDVDRIDRGNVEAAFRTGSVAVLSEANYARIERGDGTVQDAYGAFAQASWLVTGEVQPYSTSYFGQIAPDRAVTDGGLGAVELAARLDGSDLGEQGAIGRATLAANWHLTRALRLGLNASYTETDDAPPLGDGTPAPEDLRAVFFRLQYAH